MLPNLLSLVGVGIIIGCTDYRAVSGDGVVSDIDRSEYCTYCHGTKGISIAPPPDTEGNKSSIARGVGAHKRHVDDKGILCETCHKVPQSLEDEGHMDSKPPAEVVFNGLAVAHGAKPSVEYVNGTTVMCKNVYCHGAVLNGGSNTTPKWNGEEEELKTFGACGACHGLPPNTGKHWIHSVLGFDCSMCHKTVYQDGKIVREDLHVNGNKDVSLSVGTYNSYLKRCSGVCHEDRSWQD